MLPLVVVVIIIFLFLLLLFLYSVSIKISCASSSQEKKTRDIYLLLGIQPLSRLVRSIGNSRLHRSSSCCPLSRC